MNIASSLKGLGYLVSTVSVALLGIVAWKSASEHPLLFACLIGGMATSMLGRTLRWISHRIDHREKKRLEAEVEGGGARAATADFASHSAESARQHRAA